MTLYRQLLLTVSIIFAVLLMAVYLVEFNATREFLAEQQQTNVINTTTSLGLALTPYLDSGDEVGAESVIRAVFDGGYYRQIQLELFATDKVILNENPIELQDVPRWFTSLGIFENAVNEQTLTSGWLQLGKLRVEGHSGYAYRQLWQSMSELLSFFLVGYLITLLLLMRAMSYLLKPLYQIREQAVEIQNRHFGHPIPLPKTPELKALVGAINQMSSRLAQQFKELASEAEALRRRAYLDETSGLGNRAYFVSQVNNWVAEEQRGGVALLAVDILDDIYQNEGYAARDQLVRSVAQKLLDATKDLQHAAVARISATEFALLLPGLEDDELLQTGEQLYQHVLEQVVNPLGVLSQVCAVGLAQRRRGEDVGALLTLADNALQTARTKMDNRAALAQSGESMQCLGRIGWKTLVCDAVEQHLMRFKLQPVRLLDRQLFHMELFTAIVRDGEEYHAGQFLPAIEQFALGERFDMDILMRLPALLEQNELPALAINLTAGALRSDSFRLWLIDYLNAHQQFSQQITFEIPESVLVQYGDEMESLCEAIHRYGFSFGVDQYGRHIQSLDYLARLRPAYVKVDFGYTAQVLQEEADTQFLAAICRVARNLGIHTIAQRIETIEQVERLQEFYIDGYQGYIDPPVKLSEDKH